MSQRRQEAETSEGPHDGSAAVPRSSRKRARSAVEGADTDDAATTELEIDVTADEPLSKRAARRLKKGRSLKQAPSSQKPLPAAFHADSDDEGDRDEEGEGAGDEDDDDDDDTARDETKDVQSKGKSKSGKKDKDKKDRKDRKDRKDKKGEKDADESAYKKGTNGIWIGNLSFRTTETDLRTFFCTLRPLGKAVPASAFATIAAADVVRVSLPAGEGKRDANKGFAYVDFATPEQRDTALALSERILGGRNVLIKPADSFEGRPAVAKQTAATATATAAAETKILYVGNLSFDVTESDLADFLGGAEAAGIKKVRMATFEDSGKCKGFAFCDFHTADQVRAVLRNPRLRSMNGRKLKMEFGEDRSLRRKPASGNGGGGRMADRHVGDDDDDKKVDPRTIPSGRALATAQRASHAILPSSGKRERFA